MMYDDVCNITHIANLTKMGKKLKILLPIINAGCYLNIILKYDIYSWIFYMFNATYTVLFCFFFQSDMENQKLFFKTETNIR